MDQYKHGKALLDYTSIEIMEFQDDSSPTSNKNSAVPSFSTSTAPEIPTSIVSHSIQPTVHSSFSTDLSSINYLLLHRRLCHVGSNKLHKMCKLQTILGLPQRISKRLMTCGSKCWICNSATMTSIPKGIRVNTSFLRPGELIHIDFCFINVLSIRGFTCVLLIVDARTRNKWEFGTLSKRPPIDILDFFLTQCRLDGRPVLKIRTDRGGELAKSSKICDLLINKHKCGLQTTAGYLSWLNGKAESHNKGMTRMLWKALGDAGLPQFLWCLALSENK